MHTLELSLDDYVFQGVVEQATQEGKTPAQWVQEVISRLQNKSRPIGLAKDKGIPLPDSFSDSLPDDFLAFFQDVDVENPPELSELFGKVPPCFKSAAEVDTFIRAERDAWDD